MGGVEKNSKGALSIQKGGFVMKVEELWGTTVKVNGHKIKILKPPKGSKYDTGYNYALRKRKIIYLAADNYFPQATLEHELCHFMQYTDFKTRIFEFIYTKLPFFKKDEWPFLTEAAAYAHGSKYVPLSDRTKEIKRYGRAMAEYDNIKRGSAECEKQIRKKIKEGGLY